MVGSIFGLLVVVFFFFNDTATTEISPLPLHDALPILVFFDITASAHGRATMVGVIERAADQCFMPLTVGGGLRSVDDMRSEEHTSELQSQSNLVCRLLLEKKERVPCLITSYRLKAYLP